MWKELQIGKVDYQEWLELILQESELWPKGFNLFEISSKIAKLWAYPFGKF